MVETVSQSSTNYSAFISPHVHGTRAPAFDSAYAQNILQGPSKTIPEYKQRFTLWLHSLLYREFGHCQDSEVTWFIDGLLSRHQLFLTQEYVDLKQFHFLPSLHIASTLLDTVVLLAAPLWKLSVKEYGSCKELQAIALNFTQSSLL
jgi:hypothetical protein